MLDQYQLSPLKCQETLKTDNFALLDVRTKEEFEMCNLSHLGEHTLIPIDEIEQSLEELDKNKKYIIYCHHGVRSLHVQHFLFSKGFSSVYNMIGGIEAWSCEVDPSIKRY